MFNDTIRVVKFNKDIISKRVDILKDMVYIKKTNDEVEMITLDQLPLEKRITLCSPPMLEDIPLNQVTDINGLLDLVKSLIQKHYRVTLNKGKNLFFHREFLESNLSERMQSKFFCKIFDLFDVDFYIIEGGQSQDDLNLNTKYIFLKIPIGENEWISFHLLLHYEPLSRRQAEIIKECKEREEYFLKIAMEYNDELTFESGVMKVKGDNGFIIPYLSSHLEKGFDQFNKDYRVCCPIKIIQDEDDEFIYLFIEYWFRDLDSCEYVQFDPLIHKIKTQDFKKVMGQIFRELQNTFIDVKYMINVEEIFKGYSDIKRCKEYFEHLDLFLKDLYVEKEEV